MKNRIVVAGVLFAVQASLPLMSQDSSAKAQAEEKLEL
jgi:hypothetical protein